MGGTKTRRETGVIPMGLVDFVRAQTADPSGSSQPDFAIEKSRLEKVGFLGAGSFGLVTLERDQETQTLYAMKALSKGHIVQEGIKDQVLNERSCWATLSSPFIVKLFCTF